MSTTPDTSAFINAIACDLEEGGFRQVSGTTLRRTLATAVSAALPLLQPLPGTPSSRWAADGQSDPHGDRYACERAVLALGHLTDDELANAVYLHGNEQPSMADLVAGKALSGIVYLTAAKDRIRWLSRALAATGKQQGGEVQGDALGWSGWATQKPGHMPKLWGTREIAELNHDLTGDARLIFLSEQPAQGVDRWLTEEEREWIDYAIAHMRDDSEPEDLTCADALDRLLRRADGQRDAAPGVAS